MRHVDSSRRPTLTVQASVLGLLFIWATSCANNESTTAPGTTVTVLDTSTTSPAASTTVQAATTTEPVSTAQPSTTTEPATTTTIDPACAQLQEPISSLSVDVAGQQRAALVHLPGGRAPAKPSRVVLLFHGSGDSTAKLAEWTGLIDLADREGFVVVQPQGNAVELFPGLHVDPGWDILGLGVDEAGFVGTLLDELALKVCIDARRVYAAGYSNGGALALALSCTLGDRFAAVAAVAAIPVYACPTPHAVPTVIFHGLDDGFWHYDGDATLGVPSIEKMAGDVATRNGCAATAPTVSTIATDVDKLTWAGCAAPTEMYRISANGHAWPGGHTPPYTKPAFAELLVRLGEVPTGLTPEQAADNVFLSNPAIDATATVWQFFTNQD